MDLQKDWLTPTDTTGLAPCRWTVNARRCRDSVIITAGYGISTGCAALIIILLLAFILRRKLHRQWGKSLTQCPPLLLLCILYILCMICFMVHGIIVLVDPPTPYWVREVIRSLSYFFLFNAPVPHIIHLITMVAPTAGLLSILSYLQIDYENPRAYKWLYTCACILYIYPCLVIAWFYQAYAMRFAEMIDAQLSEVQYSPSFPWGLTGQPVTMEDRDSAGGIPTLGVLAASLEKMKSLYAFAMIGIGWSIVILIIMASVPNGAHQIPIFISS
ncbi:hypothetical protein BJ684DRAFT_19421 [Piptocephalis cylindrospora]|uniref:Uncharacterized protein n=1 Tax=Piptocephalis cylindrospora TaxID=1907219 RepID=A0A4P9Y5T0_9FUNG|nr:hypothetical protein BJ684DRAFT_19421 [Piptocephalis cylindrospora]|eukprot:RKP14154.1 hypothetical protein BJ684DRAFT_19421 [Piptocephalis cylindrospora]